MATNNYKTIKAHPIRNNGYSLGDDDYHAIIEVKRKQEWEIHLYEERGKLVAVGTYGCIVLWLPINELIFMFGKNILTRCGYSEKERKQK